MFWQWLVENFWVNLLSLLSLLKVVPRWNDEMSNWMTLNAESFSAWGQCICQHWILKDSVHWKGYSICLTLDVFTIFIFNKNIRFMQQRMIQIKCADDSFKLFFFFYHITLKKRSYIFHVNLPKCPVFSGKLLPGFHKMLNCCSEEKDKKWITLSTDL